MGCLECAPRRMYQSHLITACLLSKQRRLLAADECDEAMEDLKETRRRVSALARPPPGHVPLAARLRAAASATVSGLLWALRFLLGLPGRLACFYRLPRAERRATYARGWAVVKKEAKHYWVGTKLLGKDVRIASRLCGQILGGRQLTRRERQQLTRTTADIFRLVPMLVFVVVPFMELLLPVRATAAGGLEPSTREGYSV